MRTLRLAAFVAVVAVVAAPAAPAAAQSKAGVVQARVRVQWVDAAGTHTAELDVLAGPGMMRFVAPDGSTVMLAPSPSARRAGMAHKFTVTTRPSETVAGRPAQVQEVYEGARLVERREVDPDWQLVLRRVEYDAAGRPSRTIEVERIAAASDADRQALSQAARSAARPPKARSVATAPAPFRAPAALAAEYQRVGLAMEGSAMHATYSDGVHEVSVFGQAGRLSTKGLPPGLRVPVGSHRGRLYAWAGGDVLMWQAGGVVYTAVGDAPADELEAAAASMPGGRGLTMGERVRRACRAVVGALTG
jgi:hypothetical protein